MKSKLVVLAIVAAGFAGPVAAQTNVNLTIDGSPYSGGALSLESFNLSGGELSISVTSSGSGGGGDGGGDPVNYTLTVSAPTNGSILNNNDGGAVMSGTYSYPQGTSISLRLQPASGYVAASWGGACNGASLTGNCTFTMGSNRSVSATFQAEGGGEGGGGTCGALPDGVTVKNTSVVGTTYFDTISHATTSRNQVFAYNFATPNSNIKSKVDSTRATGGEGKLVVISECPGSLTPAHEQSRCSTYSSETSAVWYNTDPNASRQCVLQKGKTYYANVFNRSSATTPATCNTNCGFYFQKD